MNETKWMELDEQQRVELVEPLLDECIHETERAEIRRGYIRQHGADGLVFHHSRRESRSPRIYDAELRRKILELIEEHPRQTIPQLRRILTKDPNYAETISTVSDRSIYRFLAEHGLTQKQRAAKAIDPTWKSFHFFVGRCYPFTLERVVIAWSRSSVVARPCIRIHHHRIDTEPDHIRFLNAQSPQEHASQDPAEKPHVQDGDGLEKTLRRMGGDHSVLDGLDRPGISRVIPQSIKASQGTPVASRYRDSRGSPVRPVSLADVVSQASF